MTPGIGILIALLTEIERRRLRLNVATVKKDAKGICMISFCFLLTGPNTNPKNKQVAFAR